MKNKYSEEDKIKMVELYNSGLSQKQVAEIMGCSKSCVEKTMHQYSVPQRNKRYYAKKFDDKTEKEIINDYFVNGQSIREIAKKYGGTTTPIVTLFKNEDLNFREPSSYRKYSIDEHYFDNIDTEEKAYILGFLYADGANCSTKNHYIISLTVHPKDIDILNKIRNELKMESPIFDHTDSNSGRKYKKIQICNKHMVSMLEKYGVVPKKSLIIQYPEWIRDDLARHFLRGLFDGDGSIATKLSNINYCGSKYLMTYIKTLFKKLFEVDFRVQNRSNAHPDFMSMTCSRHAEMAKVLSYLYDDSTIYLERKYLLYLQFKEKYMKDIA